MKQKFVFLPEYEVVLARTMLELVSEYSAVGETFCPTEVARRIGGSTWRRLMPYMRAIAVSLAYQKQLGIYFKGRPTDPSDFSGIYRIGAYMPWDGEHGSLDSCLSENDGISQVQGEGIVRDSSS